MHTNQFQSLLIKTHKTENAVSSETNNMLVISPKSCLSWYISQETYVFHASEDAF